MRAAILLGLAFLAMFCADARGQPRDVDATQPTQTFESDLGGLAHVLGGAHYIRILCAGRGDQIWREKMTALMNLEGPPGTPRRQMMVQEFNAGYREQEARFPGCSPEAQQAENELKAKGARFSQALAARYRD